MDKSRLKPIMIFHYILLLVALILSFFSAMRTFGSFQISSELFSSGAMSAIFFYGLYKIITAIALCFCIIYIWKQYSKKAALYYKVFLSLMVMATLFSVLVLISSLNDSVSFYAINSIIAHAIKIVALLFLALGNDIGKRKAWLLFFVIVAMDLIIGGISYGSDLLLFKIIGFVSRLAMDGTIGLALNGKYLDKETRDTV